MKKPLHVAITVEAREAQDIYPRFRDEAIKKGNQAEADVYQRVVDSEQQHMDWFQAALKDFQSGEMVAA